LSRSAD